MEHSEEIEQLRNLIRDEMGDTPIYTHSIIEIMDIIRTNTPDADLHDGAVFTLSLCLIMFASPCEQVCIHTYARSLGALADRILLDLELAHQVN